MSRFRIEHVAPGQPPTVLDVREWRIQRFSEPGEPEQIVPSPAAELADGTLVLFDPRVRVVNLGTGACEYDGPARYAAVDGRIVRRRFDPGAQP